MSAYVVANSKKQCAAQVHNDYGVSFHSCVILATVTEQGKWWCKRHAPSTVNAKQGAENKQSDTLGSKRDALRDTHSALTHCRADLESAIRDGSVFVPPAYGVALAKFDAARKDFERALSLATAAKYRGVGHYRDCLRWYR